MGCASTHTPTLQPTATVPFDGTVADGSNTFGHVADCFLSDGDCASCCGACAVTNVLDNADSEEDCVCYTNEGQELSETFTGTKGNDCVYITGDEIIQDEVHGDYGDDTIVIVGNKNKGINGGNGDDIIKIIGDSNEYVMGGRGNDKITVDGDENFDIDGERDDDKIKIFGDSNYDINGDYGDDVIIVTGNKNHHISGSEDDDTITVTGDENYDIDGKNEFFNYDALGIIKNYILKWL